mmetsp:Transcript_5744/g.18992  ORF Transcript_5744/g.18992 Transcript_5744/m.18992 type:complete len:220 (+) Transcript_5744:531-1190(+)
MEYPFQSDTCACAPVHPDCNRERRPGGFDTSPSEASCSMTSPCSLCANSALAVMAKTPSLAKKERDSVFVEDATGLTDLAPVVGTPLSPSPTVSLNSFMASRSLRVVGGGDGGDGGGAGLGGGAPNGENFVLLKKISAPPKAVRYSHCPPRASPSPAPNASIVAFKASACCFRRISSSATDSSTACCTEIVASSTLKVSCACACNALICESPNSNTVFQ